MNFSFASTLVAGLLLSVSSFADTDTTDAAAPAAQQKRDKVYIVQLADKPLAAYEGNIAGYAATKPSHQQKLDRDSVTYKNYADLLASRRNEALAAIPGARKVHEYKVAFNGFAAQMTGKQADLLRNRKDVLAVWEDELLKPQTDSTRSYLGLDNIPGPWFLGATGEDVVVGIIDSGIHPEHPSVADVPTRKRGNRGRKIPFGPVPDSFTGKGCEFGNSEFNPADEAFDCNNKLIKAAAFSDSFLSVNTLADYEFLSARDADGHGTHTATTAAGNFGVEGTMNGDSTGVLSGMAPRARIAVYKICWDAPDPDDSGCFSSDSMAAIDQAVADGVDVINYSVGGASTTFTGPDDIAFLYAADAGVFVATSAGNSGPGEQTIGTPSGVPWITSVAAAEDEQNFGTGIQIDAPADIAGIFEGLQGSGPVQLADSGAISGSVVLANPVDACLPLTNPDMSGQIALVMRGGCAFSIKYDQAAAAGASAIVVYNDGAAADRIDPLVMSAPDTTIPGIMIRSIDGDQIAASADVTGSLSPEIQVSRNNRITGFSSRGANAGAPDIIKPDLAAPGVGIVAGVSPVSYGGEIFAPLSGTSMASPHVAGVMALLKQVRPEWTPAMAKSALMTSARQNMLKSFGSESADPFDMGAGFIQPGHAFFPGLVYDAGLYDYFAFLCGAENQLSIVAPGDCDYLSSAGYSLDSSDLNLPSIGIAELVGSQTVTRTVTSVGKGTKWYWASVESPNGIKVEVSPRLLRIREGESASFQVTFTATEHAVQSEWAFGAISWTHGWQRVRSPIAVKPVPISTQSAVSGSGTAGSLDIPVVFGYSGSYVVNVNGLAVGVPHPSAVEDGLDDLSFFTVPEGTSFTRVALFDADVGAGDGSDDLDLVVLGPAPDFPLVGNSGSPTSAEAVDMLNPVPGDYAVFVVDYASAPGPTDYTLFNFNLNGDASNTIITAPVAEMGSQGNVNVEWLDLPAGTRALGILQHSNGSETLAETELMINTQ